MKKKIIIIFSITGVLSLVLLNLLIFVGNFISLKYHVEEISEMNTPDAIYPIFNQLSIMTLLNLFLFLIVLYFSMKNRKKNIIVFFALFTIVQIGFIIDKYLFLAYRLNKLDIDTIIYDRIYPMVTALSWLMIINLVLFVVSLIFFCLKKSPK
ncbi:hypothetical protein [Capnocytophaga catalasegens]|uniref:ABC transporter permease n=1 Tax=Capnocytophaga catalasegens TaxID=1004260 RepID=A0AAV5AZS3_9FLAO|nr:hypothetical protein [Capnocytophaga catalasegens]GIZ16203.1 hypothetical protein RCZ03_22030 [Capnocytophaga catalasegens]GJM51631.1 hypothetical protein RCZ15_26040 [Capnocytophaga catalasegens]GJM54338.1 hypothetical protein RCZ16_26540 [Capnocytophaga catalasegens]